MAKIGCVTSFKTAMPLSSYLFLHRLPKQKQIVDIYALIVHINKKLDFLNFNCLR